MREDHGSALTLAIDDEELTELALAADPESPLSPSAVPIDIYLSQVAPLPVWYMPPVARARVGRWSRPIVFTVVAAFVLIDLLGLCNTYGVLSL
jgi:hypothetical protein